MCVIETITYIYPDDSRHRQPYHRLCQQSVDGQPCAQAEHRNLGERRLNNSPTSRPPERPDMPPQGLYNATHPSNALQPPDVSPSTVARVSPQGEKGKKTLVIRGGRFELLFRSKKDKKEKRKSKDSETDASDFQPIVLPQVLPEAPEPPPAVPGYMPGYGEPHSPMYYEPPHSPVTPEHSRSPPILVVPQTPTSADYPFPTYEERIPPSRRHSHRHRHSNVIHQTLAPTPPYTPSRSLSTRRLTDDHHWRSFPPRTRHSAPARSPLPPPPPSPPPPPPPPPPSGLPEAIETDTEHPSRQTHHRSSSHRHPRRQTWHRESTTTLPSQETDTQLDEETQAQHDLSRAHHREEARRQRRDRDRDLDAVRDRDRDLDAAAVAHQDLHHLQTRIESLEREVQEFRAHRLDAEARLVGGRRRSESGSESDFGGRRRSGRMDVDVGAYEEEERRPAVAVVRERRSRPRPRPRFEEVRIDGERSIRVERPRGGMREGRGWRDEGGEGVEG